MSSRLLPRLSHLRHFHSESIPFHKNPSRIKSESLPISLYGGRHLVTMLPGNGIGPEMTSYVKEIFTVAQAPVDFEEVEGSGQDLVTNAITSIRRNRVGIKGNLKNVIESDGYIAPNVMIRTKLDLFVYVVHYKTYENVRSKCPVDLVIIRQNTEGEYSLLEHESVKGVVESMKIVTRENTERLAKFAFDYARRHNRKKVTVVHKSKQLELSDGLFLQTIKSTAQNYKDLQFEDIYIDRCCQKLVKQPNYFDLLLMPNLYGNIASNIVCGLSGGAGLFSGINYGEEFAIFEPATRQTGESLTGKNMANPVAMLNASVNLLRHLGKHQHANLISDSINYALTTCKMHTFDVGGERKTTEVVQCIKDFIKCNLHVYKKQF